MSRRVDSTAANNYATRAALPAACIAGLLGVSAAVAAPQEQSPVNNFELTPFLGVMAGGQFEDPVDGSDRDVENDMNWGLFFNINADSPARQYEFIYAQQGTAVEGVDPFDLDIQYLHVGGIVNFTDQRYVVPFFGMTVGATRFAPDAPGFDDEVKLSFSAGGGVKVPVTDHIGIRFDARAFVTLLDTDSDIFCVSAPATTGAGCRIRASSDTFLQYTATLGVIVGF